MQKRKFMTIFVRIIVAFLCTIHALCVCMEFNRHEPSDNAPPSRVRLTTDLNKSFQRQELSPLMAPPKEISFYAPLMGSPFRQLPNRNH